MNRILIVLFFSSLNSINCLGQDIYSNNKKNGSNFQTKFNLTRTVSEIAMYWKVDGAAIGYAGSRSKQFDRFCELKANASDSELVLLTDHFSPVVKAYAFWALAGKNYSGIKQIIEKHLNDNQIFKLQSGCTTDNEKINKWFLTLGEQFLTREELATYQKQLATN